jgi:transcriptional regulator with XRE-family HTH domain
VTDVDPIELDRLGAAVRLRRLQLRLSQEQAGRRAGMHRNYFGAIERGEVNPTYGTMLRLAAGLRMPLEKLIAEARRRR